MARRNANTRSRGRADPGAADNRATRRRIYRDTVHFGHPHDGHIQRSARRVPIDLVTLGHVEDVFPGRFTIRNSLPIYRQTGGGSRSGRSSCNRYRSGPWWCPRKRRGPHIGGRGGARCIRFCSETAYRYDDQQDHHDTQRDQASEFLIRHLAPPLRPPERPLARVAGFRYRARKRGMNAPRRGERQ